MLCGPFVASILPSARLLLAISVLQLHANAAPAQLWIEWSPGYAAFVPLALSAAVAVVHPWIPLLNP